MSDEIRIRLLGSLPGKKVNRFSLEGFYSNKALESWWFFVENQWEKELLEGYAYMFGSKREIRLQPSPDTAGEVPEGIMHCFVAVEMPGEAEEPTEQ